MVEETGAVRREGKTAKDPLEKRYDGLEGE
jgi:hypothetical protein